MITLSENFRALFYTPFYAAHATGAYAKEGVEVDFRLSSDPNRTAAALRSGDVEVMWGGPLRVLLTHDADPASDVVCFCDVVARDPFFVIGREPLPTFRPADLAKVRLGTVSEVPTPWLCLQDDIRRDGVDPETVSRVADQTMAANADALRAGSLDAVQVFQPYAEELLASGAGHLWYAAANRGLTAYTTLVTRRSVLDRKRDELLRHGARDVPYTALDQGDARDRNPAGARLIFSRCAAGGLCRRDRPLPRARSLRSGPDHAQGGCGPACRRHAVRRCAASRHPV